MDLPSTIYIYPDCRSLGINQNILFYIFTTHCVYIDFCIHRQQHKKTTLRPRQNGRHFTDDIFKCISLDEKFWISTKILLKYVPWDVIGNMSVLVQILAWCQIDKPLFDPMMTQFANASPSLDELIDCGSSKEMAYLRWCFEKQKKL